MNLLSKPTMVRATALVVALVPSAAALGCGGGGATDRSPRDTGTAVADAPRPLAGTTVAAAPAAALVIAHRGSSAYAPEHTFAAYDLAIEQGAELIEQDLQMTADGVLVVLHDDTLDRTARGPAGSCRGPVATKTLAQLRECEVGSWFNEAQPDRADPSYRSLGIPTLEEVFDRYGTDVGYYIETKSPEARPGMEQALVDLLRGSGIGERVLVQSFSAESLALLHRLQPDLPLVQLRRSVDPPVDGAALDAIREYAVAVAPASASVDEALVGAAHQRCLAVHPYTVDDAVEMGRLLDLGVDAIFTNAPDVLREERTRHAAPPARCSATPGQ